MLKKIQPLERGRMCSIVPATGLWLSLRNSVDMSMLPPLLGRLLCWLGFHDFRVIDRAFEFGDGGGIEKVECRRCGAIMVRQT